MLRLCLLPQIESSNQCWCGAAAIRQMGAHFKNRPQSEPQQQQKQLQCRSLVDLLHFASKNKNTDNIIEGVSMKVRNTGLLSIHYLAK